VLGDGPPDIALGWKMSENAGLRNSDFLGDPLRGDPVGTDVPGQPDGSVYDLSFAFIGAFSGANRRH